MKRTNALASFLAVALIMGQANWAIAAPATKPAPKKPTTKTSQPVVHTLDKLNPVKLTAKSFVKLSDVNLLTQDNNNILAYTLTYYNQDSKIINLNDYWTKVRSKSGTEYSVTQSTNDKDKVRVAPQSTLSVTYHAKVGSNIKISDLEFLIFKWDFSSSNWMKTLGKYTIPATFSTSTPINQTRKFRLNDTPVYAKVEQMFVFPADNYNHVNVNLNLENIGSKVLENPKIKLSIRANNGANYPLVQDESEYKIQPRDKKKLSLMTKIPSRVKLDKLELQIVQEDETSKINYAIATMQLPKSNSKDLVTPKYKEKTVTVKDTKILTKIQTAWVTPTFENKDISITFDIQNLGTKPLKLPKYEFTMHADSGAIFPISNKTLENVTLKPKETKSFKLNVSIPSDAGSDKLKLHMNMPSASGSGVSTASTGGQANSGAGTSGTSSSADTTFAYPVAIYEVPELISIHNAIGEEFRVANSKGSFWVSLASIQRLPWTDGDIVSAKLTIKNKEFKSVEIPKLEGMFKVDSAKSTGDTKLVQSDGSMIVPPQSEVDVYIVTKVPTYFDISQLQIALMEKLGEEASELIQFTNLGSLKDLDKVKFNTFYDLKTAGRNAEITARKTLVYPGTSAKMVVTDLVMKNKEKRPANLSQIVAYYRSKDGELFKADTIQVKSPTTPEGKNIVTVSASIPDKVYLSDMELIIGEGITDGKFTAPGTEANGYVNAVALGLDMELPGFVKSMEKIEMFPYTLAMHGVKATTSGGSLNLEFDYHLDRDLTYNMGEYQHKVILELMDSSGRTFTHELKLGDGLKEGKNKHFTHSFSDSFFEKVKSGHLQLNVYDQFKDHKLKLASQGITYTTKVN
ncbi:hypothetical protein [Paenibacillus sp. 481]|uniref:hypothetical protein n=1 Tax=Paenibacillus sp. 481 TaxID=2835869 RepID=UPI001E5BE056|nr:hypothetical protein [Paenibacillus sp. 481]UHA75694.1 hypothetical protein KIK04_12285 [Paenibacillus sp. 481]